MKRSPDDKLAVVTGAAGGLGSCFARNLAERGYRLLLVDRRLKQLERVCEAITARYGVAAEPYAVDLSKVDEVESLANHLQQMPDLELLVNNAGFGTIDYVVDTDVSHLVAMVQVHVLAPIVLTRAVLPGMLQKDRGAIINVSSLAAWFYSAGNVPYSSTKNCLAAFTMGLHQELRGTNIHVQALCPGFVRTEFHDSEAMKSFNMEEVPAGLRMSAETVVNCSLRRLGGRRVIVIPGLRYRILGRLAQMPLLQPLFQRLARRPRCAARKSRDVEHAPTLSPAAQTAENV